MLVPALLLAGLGPLAAGCDGTPSATAGTTAAGRLASVLGTPAWADAVDVGEGRDDHGVGYVATVVTLRPTATARQVAGFVAALPAAVRRAGLPATYNDRRLTLVTRSGARLGVAWQPRVEAGALQRGAAEWLAAASSLGGDVSGTLLSTGGAAYVVELGVGGTRDVARAAARAEALSRPASVWTFSARTADASLSLVTAGRPTAAERATWSALGAAAARVAAPFRVARVEASFGDRVSARLGLTAPDVRAVRPPTPARDGAAVEDAVRGQLAATTAAAASIDAPWTYTLTWAPRSAPGDQRSLATVLSDQGTVAADRASARWTRWVTRLLGPARSARDVRPSAAPRDRGAPV